MINLIWSVIFLLFVILYVINNRLVDKRFKTMENRIRQQKPQKIVYLGGKEQIGIANSILEKTLDRVDDLEKRMDNEKAKVKYNLSQYIRGERIKNQKTIKNTRKHIFF